ncbi:Asp-tRNA(Asn)/Glu-tRNA(Gln) amidotransferase subunit GatC [Candidatus Falkowbacteria bacterium]|nr:Asp-tRNA(Asn)/Glu-tRNA(Gln) amidotransferase subunit GatC [Candidatus Falkowbacteria bacterium]
MKLSQKEVEHIARLARLDLSAPEKKKYAKQLTDILDYIDQLQEVETTNVEPTYQVTGLGDVDRLDEIVDCAPETVAAIKQNWPDREGEFIRVKAVFDTTEE